MSFLTLSNPVKNNKVVSMRMKNEISRAESWLNNAQHKEKTKQIKQTIKEIVSLKNDGAIDDDTFSEIMEIFILKFVENEVSFRIEETLSEKLFGLGFNAQISNK